MGSNIVQKKKKIQPQNRGLALVAPSGANAGELEQYQDMLTQLHAGDTENPATQDALMHAFGAARLRRGSAGALLGHVVAWRTRWRLAGEAWRRAGRKYSAGIRLWLKVRRCILHVGRSCI